MVGGERRVEQRRAEVGGDTGEVRGLRGEMGDARCKWQTHLSRRALPIALGLA